MLLLLGAAHGAAAREVRFPIAVDYPVLRDTIRDRLRGASDGDGVWSVDDGCRGLTLRDFDARADGPGRLTLSAAGRARAAFELLGFCIFPVRWDGFLESTVEPVVGSDWQMRFRPVSWRLLGPDRRPSAVASRLWSAVEGRVDDEMQALSLDLGPPLDEVRALVRSAVPPDHAAPVLAALDSLRVVTTTVDTEGVKVELAMDVADVAPQPAVPEPALTPAELTRWQAALESFDAFLVFVVKDVGVLGTDATDRGALLDLLLDARQQLLAALAEPTPGAGDPVRELFLTSWDRLRAIIRQVAAHGGLERHGARYVTFLAAGDALHALEEIGPSLGLEISADGLRRLARLLAPEYAGDPLFYSEAPDPGLRELFRFHDPEAPDAAPPPADDGAWWWPGPRSAFAAEPEEFAALAQRLDRWVPADQELDAYRTDMVRLLDQVSGRESAASEVDGRFRDVFAHLVPAVAWQESCWRQFVRRGGRVTYLQSATGDIGLMQVNRRVWRGFFDLQKLEWNIAYNAGAGAQILARLLTQYGVREADERIDHAARATYSAYNGGPGSYRRYRAARVPRALRAIDEAFWQKYQAMVAGQALDYVLCVERWGTKTATAGRQLGVASSAGSTR